MPRDNKGIVTLDAIREKYNETVLTIRLIQYCDHLDDFFIDLENEIRTGNATPNFIVTELHKRGQLLNDDGNIRF